MSEQFRGQLLLWSEKNGLEPIEIHQSKGVRSKEKLTDRDLKELMGINRQTLKRGRSGAFKQK
ncbi:hypothetical protein GLV94_05240 [Virgibacillus halodenitrificans]|uniref:hypothetical protein n=1 Tax=Virgibacillus halodenitrificans TaxID=1482 RepID=UPI0013FFB203|nr:hypothetical protein [Virgibacillus halodenitrificans]MYL45039.1 hypothetical protein [Virgibacillus halodenitrificans]